MVSYLEASNTAVAMCGDGSGYIFQGGFGFVIEVWKISRISLEQSFEDVHRVEWLSQKS